MGLGGHNYRGERDAGQQSPAGGDGIAAPAEVRTYDTGIHATSVMDNVKNQVNLLADRSGWVCASGALTQEQVKLLMFNEMTAATRSLSASALHASPERHTARLPSMSAYSSMRGQLDAAASAT